MPTVTTDPIDGYGGRTAPEAPPERHSGPAPLKGEPEWLVIDLADNE